MAESHDDRPAPQDAASSTRPRGKPPIRANCRVSRPFQAVGAGSVPAISFKPQGLSPWETVGAVPSAKIRRDCPHGQISSAALLWQNRTMRVPTRMIPRNGMQPLPAANRLSEQNTAFHAYFKQSARGLSPTNPVLAFPRSYSRLSPFTTSEYTLKLRDCAVLGRILCLVAQRDVILRVPRFE